MAGESTSQFTILGGLAAVLAAIAWPTVALVFLLMYRAKIGIVIDTLASKLKQAKHLKAGQIELDTAEEIDRIVSQTGAEASRQELSKEIPESQIRAAQVVGERLNAAPITFSQKLDVVHRQLYELIGQYEQVRREMPSGPARTRIMNQIAARMRALSIAAQPLVVSLMAGQRPGERLAAIMIQQVHPDVSSFDWLIERVTKEEQPFLMFHAALAILELARTYRYLRPQAAIDAVRAARDKVANYSGGAPDTGTIEVLDDALAELAR